ncbi:MAG: DNA-binding protein [Deltaproteobacteria bacterium]|jgi:plasmid stability protein|nr:DNA-binding protein [Deltaproteobacteria bacterium]
MPQLIVRSLEADLVAALKRRAVRNGRSAEAEHRAILREVLAGEREGLSFKALLAAMPDVGEDDELTPPRDLPRHVSG